MPLIKPSSRVVEVGNASEQVLRPRKDDFFKMGQERAAQPLALRPGSDSQQLQIVAEQKPLAKQREPGHSSVGFNDEPLTPLWQGFEQSSPVGGSIAQRLPGLRFAQ